METHPPKLIEDIFGALVPAACRENVLGDWYERYRSPSQYILDAIATLPLIIASQIRRTFRIELFAAEACALYIGFSSASLVYGPYLYDHSLMLPLVIVTGVALLVLIIADAYAVREAESPRRVYTDAGLAFVCAHAAKGVIGFVHPQSMVPAWLMLIGTAVGLPLLVLVRWRYGKPDRRPQVAGGVAPGLMELHRRSEEQHRTAWRVNLGWLWGALLVVVTDWNPFPERPPSGLMVAVVVLGVFVQFWPFRRGFAGRGRRLADPAITTWRSSDRVRLARMRNGLRFFAGREGYAPFLFLLIAIPFLLLIVRAAFRQSSGVNSSHWWLTLAGLLAFGVVWFYVRRVNESAAQAIQEEIDVLDSMEEKQ